MPVSAPKRARLGHRLARPFYLSTLIITLLATYSLLARRHNGRSHHVGEQQVASPVARRAVDQDCRLVHHAEDQCAFILANCQDDEAGLLSYLTLYYCDLGRAQPVAFAVLVAWLGLLFTTIGIAASDFFSVNLSTIASILGLSESLAGVTFLAFGNGSPDVFSTFAAMGSNSGSMAVGELIGAASFITAVVAGSMALVREFKVARRTFVRDVCFFILAVSFSMVFLADGHLHLWECCVMIGFYVFYVVVVVGWHWLSTRKRKRRQKEAASRSNFYGGTSQPHDELEPYRDEEEDVDDTAPLDGRGGHGSGGGGEPDISALERAPRIEVGDEEAAAGDDEADSDHELQVAAEMASSMRVIRPHGVRSHTSIGPIRPSFVGALEFRSVLSSLSKSGNVRLAPMHSRGYSENFVPITASQSATPAPEFRGEPNLLALPEASVRSPGRDRALSHGDMPLNLNLLGGRVPEIVTQSPRSPEEITSDAAATALPGLSGSSWDGSLAPSADLDRRTEPDPHNSALLASAAAPLRLQIPAASSVHSSGHSSPSLSPFPGISESPVPMTPTMRSPTFAAPQSSATRDQSYFGLEIQDKGSNPVRWWPYAVLPPPQVLSSTLFPTLQGWSDKSIWDKFVSLISVPSIFLLVVTLPVVEVDGGSDEDSAEPVVDAPRPGEPGQPGASLLLERERATSVEPEGEWERYRRARSNTRSMSSRVPSGQTTPALLNLSDPAPLAAEPTSLGSSSLDGTRDTSVSSQDQHQQLVKAAQGVAPLSNRSPHHHHHPHAHETDSQATEAPETWNRWLVVVQIFAGPLFTTLILWANMAEGMDRPGRTLVRMFLISLLGSLVLLALLLATTSPHKRPKYHFLFCFLGFIISVAWISTVAGEVVGVLKAFGVILGISEAILGLTIFAVGNSLGDLVADITVARLGYPVMALSACFGGPMLNILLGVGIGGVWMTMKSANEKHVKHPDRPVHYKPYRIEVGGTLMISAVTVLLTLVFLLVAVPSNRWVMSRKIGWSLIVIWSISTAVNLIVELSGVWSDIAL